MNKHVGGFSIVQILISILLFAGLSIVTIKIRNKQIQLGKSSSYAFESLGIIDKMKTLLSSPLSCAATLKGMNARFSQIDRLWYQENQESEKKALFKQVALGGAVYGNNDVIIKSMSILEGKGFFSIENGFVIFKARFEDIASREKHFKEYVFPIHVKLDPIGLIESCFSLEGLETANIKNEIGKWQLEKGNIINIKTRTLNIGQVDRKGELNIQGGFRFGLQNVKCNKERYGTLRYDRVQGLLFCNRRELWERVHDEKSIDLVKESFVVKSESLTNETIKITPKEYAFCQLEKSYFIGGRCYSEPVSQQEYRSRWKLAAGLRVGKEISCNFSCYK